MVIIIYVYIHVHVLNYVSLSLDSTVFKCSLAGNGCIKCI